MATYTIATNGTVDGDGSAAHPWPTIAVALSHGGPGNTYLVQPGIYAADVVIPLAAAGTAGQPTVIQSAAVHKAVLYGSPLYGITTDSGCDWLVIDGFEVAGARLDGINLNGDHCVVKNCWVHHNAGDGISAVGRLGSTLTRNLVEFNGSHPLLHYGVNADGAGLTITDNIIRHNSAYGLFLSPALATSQVENNLIYGQAAQAGLFVSCPGGGGQNKIINNTLDGNAAGGIWLAGGNGEIVENNVVTETGSTFGAYFADGATVNTTPDYNLCLPAQPSFSGTHGLSADPLYVDSAVGAYWLSTGSPAAGAADGTQLPAADFWGRTPVGHDLGAFAYSAFLTTPAARSAWYQGYAYSFTPLAVGEGLPDLWASPGSVPSVGTLIDYIASVANTAAAAATVTDQATFTAAAVDAPLYSAEINS